MTSPEPTPILPLATPLDLMPAFPVPCYRQRQRILATQLDATLEIGRQREEEAAHAVRIDNASAPASILAPDRRRGDLPRPRSSWPQPQRGQVRGRRTQSPPQPVRVSPNQTLELGGRGRSSCRRPCSQLGEYAVRVDPAEDEQLELEGLPESHDPSGQAGPASFRVAMLGATFDETKTPPLARRPFWAFFQSPPNTHDFPEQAARRAAVKIVGLDVPRLSSASMTGRWRTGALYAGDPRGRRQPSSWAMPSQTLLGWVRRDRRANPFRHVPPTGPDTPQACKTSPALVVADSKRAGGDRRLYGDRRSGGSSGGFPRITEFEAKLVEAASGIAAGLRPFGRRTEPPAPRVVPVLSSFSHAAARHPAAAEILKLLEGRNAEVDDPLRRLSAASAASASGWASRSDDGVDSGHDGSALPNRCSPTTACWSITSATSWMASGEPVRPADHAVARLPRGEADDGEPSMPSPRAGQELGVPVQLGIGLNSGVARVGNTGSIAEAQRLSLGDAVNAGMARRGLLGYLGVDCLITGENAQATPARRRPSPPRRGFAPSTLLSRSIYHEVARATGALTGRNVAKAVRRCFAALEQETTRSDAVQSANV